MFVSCKGSVFTALKTFRKNESCNAAACTDFLLSAIPEDTKLFCVIGDTTSLNTGVNSGIFRRLEHYYELNVKDLLCLECLFHVVELLFSKVLAFYDGEKRSSDTRASHSAYNFIPKIN